MEAFGNKVEFNTVHWTRQWDDGGDDHSYFFGKIILRKDQIVGIEEDNMAFHQHCFLCCNILLKTGDSVLVKESYTELAEMFKTIS